MINIGIMGGTFNPIHIGHLIAAEEVRNKINLDKIIFIPTGNPPHKKESTIIPSMHRFKMTELSISTNDNFEISDIEINRKGKTYTFETLINLHKIYEDSRFYFIIGFDTLKDLGSWRRIDEVCRLCSFVVVNRSNRRDDMLEEIKLKKEKYSAEIELVDIPDIEVSSTDIRNRLSNGKSIKYLVPEAVENYINVHNLYR